VSLAPGFRWPTAFVGDWSEGGLVVRNNRLRGRVAMLQQR
jgi:hypothetical protein